jgi:membrane protease subunit HflC
MTGRGPAPPAPQEHRAVRRLLIIGIAAILVIALLSFTVTYTVRFTDAAVVTTFGKAGPEDIRTTPGLYFKMPYPFQSVTSYDTRARIVQLRLETLQTNDSRQLIVEAFCTWRVSDPLVFFQRFSNAGERAEDHYRRAEETLRNNLRSALSELSRYRMGDLFPKGSTPSKLPELETSILETLRAGSREGGRALTDDGIEAISVGINRIKFPEETTKAVFQRMESDRKRLVDQLESQGLAEAQTIKTSAESLAKTIRAFATTAAVEIRSKGDLEAAPWLRMMNEHPELAVFLRKLDFMKSAVTKRATLVFPTDAPGWDLMSPDSTNGLAAGEIPGSFDERKIAAPGTGDGRPAAPAGGTEGGR